MTINGVTCLPVIWSWLRLIILWERSDLILVVDRILSSPICSLVFEFTLPLGKNHCHNRNYLSFSNFSRPSHCLTYHMRQSYQDSFHSVLYCWSSIFGGSGCICCLYHSTVNKVHHIALLSGPVSVSMSMLSRSCSMRMFQSMRMATFFCVL